jgi:biotin carboxyl carrier protein
MDGVEAIIDDTPVEPAEIRKLEWVDLAHGIARLTVGDSAVIVLVEGRGSDWVVTLAGRRIPVTVRTWRERTLAEAESASRQHAGPLEIRAKLPGLIVAVQVEEGSSVTEGQPLLTIEAMKMQNEVRAPRDGTVASVVVETGQTVATGASLLRLE